MSISRNDLDRYREDVDSSMSKRIIPIIDHIADNCYYAPNDQVQHWSVYLHVEMMDKHLNSFDTDRFR